MKTVVAGILGLFMFGGVASAATVGPLPCTGVPVAGYTNTELSGSLECPLFDVPSAVLTGMSITFTGSIQGTITLTNGTGQTQSGTAETDSRFYFGPLTGFSIGSPLFTVVGSTGPVSLPSGQSQALPVSGSLSQAVANTSNLGAYVGSGSFQIPVATSTFLLLSFGGGIVTAEQLTQARADATVEYEYREITNVPEPTTLALLGTGLLGATIRRRRK
jgi:hypothetical protein